MYYSSPHFLEIAQNLAQTGTSWALSEIQGSILGYLAIAQDPHYQEWYQLVQDDLHIENTNLEDSLKRIFLENHLNFTQETCITLCVADENSSSADQLQSLSDLARGILYAIGAVAQEESLDQIADFDDMLEDFIAISQIDLVSGENHNAEDYKACLAHVILLLRALYEMSR